jgi:GxxExxY protein
MELDEITGAVVEASIRIHRGLGPGLLESAYEFLLAASLERRGLRVQRQLPLSFSFDGMHFEDAFRIDLLVEECVIVEVKSVERMAAVHGKQLLTYLRLSNLRVGLLLNFGAGTMKEGLKRIVNDLDPSASPRLRVNQKE